ncbi:MAG: tetratricopeptide repeat protein, partial [Proteobacteria bacterium]|nr:tetratricopeptide repeat protein [Pseudomonadota bacterium]
MIRCAPNREGDLSILAEAALSVWGAGAALLLATAVAAWFALPRPIGRAGAPVLAGLAIAAAVVAVAVAPSDPRAVVGASANETGRPSAAAVMLAEAEQKLNRGDADGAREGLARALDQFRSSGDLSGQGRAVLGMGRVEHLTGQADEARAHYAAALEFYRQAGNRAGEARTLVAIGDLAADTFHWQDAVQHFADGRRVWAQVSGPKSDTHVMLILDTVAAMPDG